MAAGGDIKPASMLELLTRLADKSLLRVELTPGDSRYHLLVTIRDYARDRLAEAAESEPVQQAHLHYFTELAEAAAARIEGIEAAGTGVEFELDRVDSELPNLRKAFEFAHAVRRLEAALRLYRELDDARGIASALQVLGSVAREQGRYARAVELPRRASPSPRWRGTGGRWPARTATSASSAGCSATSTAPPRRRAPRWPCSATSAMWKGPRGR